jgi:guanyl-specific ribonuclease Sa
MTISVLMPKSQSDFYSFLPRALKILGIFIFFIACNSGSNPETGPYSSPHPQYHKNQSHEWAGENAYPGSHYRSRRNQNPVPHIVSRQNQSPDPSGSGVPEKALEVLKYVEEHGSPMPGYEGGRKFGNYEKVLPQADAEGNLIRYQEWDVNPHEPGVNRGAQRLITSSNHKAYYTQDHYQTFTEVPYP